MKSLPGLRSDYTVSKIRAEMRRKHPHAPRTIGLVLAQLRGLFELKGEKGKCDMHLPKSNPIVLKNHGAALTRFSHGTVVARPRPSGDRR